ncbi:hypothetical protein MSBRM_0935 [Methanosarcina barkeri MS]|uniref:Uncharacterized protein n=1 Tax=Methanosarcina barkeri MS TaxID=1434108 RepID=A0A0E3QRT2_METBA|nr:hypothetical protein MSBRM_0935 [Methanosarcina barkeri MS]
MTYRFNIILMAVGAVIITFYTNGSKKGFRYSQTYIEDLFEEYEPLIKQYFEKLSS